MPPLNLEGVVETYHNRFSTVLFTWDAPDDSSRVDYYQYQIFSESNGINVYNTSNNSALVPEIVYNKNVTFLVLAGNCIGQSTMQMKTVNISRSCWYTLDLACAFSHDIIIIIAGYCLATSFYRSSQQ